MGVLILKKKDGTIITNGVISLNVTSRTEKPVANQIAKPVQAFARNNKHNLVRDKLPNSLSLKEVGKSKTVVEPTASENSFIASALPTTKTLQKTINIKNWRQAQKYLKDNAKSMADLLVMTEGETRKSVKETAEELKQNFN